MKANNLLLGLAGIIFIAIISAFIIIDRKPLTSIKYYNELYDVAYVYENDLNDSVKFISYDFYTEKVTFPFLSDKKMNVLNINYKPKNITFVYNKKDNTKISFLIQNSFLKNPKNIRNIQFKDDEYIQKYSKFIYTKESFEYFNVKNLDINYYVKQNMERKIVEYLNENFKGNTFSEKDEADFRIFLNDLSKKLFIKSELIDIHEPFSTVPNKF